jgi:diacylglycerol kinase family enzyme
MACVWQISLLRAVDAGFPESTAHNNLIFIHLAVFTVACSRFTGGGRSDVPLLIEADGELLGTTPATFVIVPGAVRVKM